MEDLRRGGLTAHKDGHNDWPHLIRGYYDNQLGNSFGPDKDLVGHVDLKRLRRGKSGGAFWSVYIDWWV
jgi:membrane dipeptidase